MIKLVRTSGVDLPERTKRIGMRRAVRSEPSKKEAPAESIRTMQDPYGPSNAYGQFRVPTMLSGLFSSHRDGLTGPLGQRRSHSMRSFWFCDLS